MGNSSSAYSADKLEDLINKHVYNVHAIGYNDVIGLPEVVYMLNHTQFYQIKSTSLIVAQKLFLKREDNAKMDLINENIKYLNKTIPLSTHPYFLLSISITQPEKVKTGEVLPVLSRQHLYSTLDEKVSGGIPLEYQQKMNLVLQILICGAVLHDLNLIHGNLSTSNVLLTSDCIAYFADFAPYKPLYFADGALDQVKLFHPNILDRCYLPPEKIDTEKASSQFRYEDLSNDEAKLNSLKSMDVFAVGCILLELMLGDSNPLFTYQKMISYRAGDKNCLDRINLVPDETMRAMITKMVQTDPKERGTFREHLSMLSNIIPKEIIELYAYMNYALRRGEFSQPDNKVAVIRMVAPKFIQSISDNLTVDEKALLGDRLDDIIFNRCFPYHLSKVAILYQLKGIINSNPLGGIFSNASLNKYIDETIALIEQTEYKIASPNPSSAIYLDGVKYLKPAKLDINKDPYSESDPFVDKVDDSPQSLEDLTENILADAKLSKAQERVMQKFTIVSNLIETICSLVRNLQLSQSYLVALELLENFSRYVRSEEVVFFILPHLQSQVVAQSNKIEKYYSINLFCKLVKRIRYVSKTLSKSSSYSGYVRSFIDLCKNDPFLKNQIFKNIRWFIKLNIVFSVLNQQSKIEEKLGKTDPDFMIDTADVKKIAKEILSDPQNNNYKGHFDTNFFTDLILKSYKDDTCAVELVRRLPEIHQFFDLQTLSELVNTTFLIYSKTFEPGFRNKAMKSIASICPSLPQANVQRILLRMKDQVFSTSEFTETAALIEALTMIVRHSKVDMLEVFKVMACVKQFVVHPNNLIVQKSLDFIKLVYEMTPQEDIVRIVAPILLGFTENKRAYCFETFDLVRMKPVTYTEYKKLQQKSNMSMTSAMSLIFEYVDKVFDTSKQVKPTGGIILQKRTFSVHRNVGNYIQEVLGSLVLYQALTDYSDDKKKELNQILTKMGNQEDKKKEQKEERDQLVEYITRRLLEHDDKLRIFPKWENKTDNYKNLISFKESFIDHIGVVRADYKFLKHFNMSVLKMCLNHIQMIVHQTKLKFVAENDTTTRVLDPNKIRRWKPSGILLTSINSHEAEVKCLVAMNDSIFISGSHDGHVKYHSLPAFTRNFIHNTELDIDLNKGRQEGDDKIQVKQLQYLKAINKLAVVTNSKEIFICDEGKGTVGSKLNCNARVTATTTYDQDMLRGCIATVNTECDYYLWDLRKKEPAMHCSLSKIRGVPSSICKINNDTTNMIATYKGYLISHDIKTNMATSTYRLIYDNNQIPIISVNQFLPHTKFRNITGKSLNKMLVALTYPSKCNQFSIFDTNQSSELTRNPKIHFESGRLESETSRPTEVPILEDVTQKEKILDINAFCDERFDYLREIYMNAQNQFCLGKSFKVRSVDSIVNLYTDIFHRQKLSIKEECLNNFTSVMQTLSAMGECNMTINKILSIPNFNVKSQIAVDNILLTGGTDRNLRFINLGNDFENVDPLLGEHGTYNAYHLSNMDNCPRSFRYSYSHDTCLFKEYTVPSSVSQGFSTADMGMDGQGQGGQSRNGLSSYHNSFLSQRKTSDTLPGHAATINDMILMEHNEALLVISCGDDGTIKVWL